MRVFFTFGLLLIFTFNAFAQKKCSCPRIGEDIYDCTPIKLKSGSKLYWNYNCDSTWLTFENKQKKKKILYSSGIIDHRLGYDYLIEYKNTFLIFNEVISGCCDPPEFLAFNSKTGKLLKNYGRILYYSEKIEDPLIIKFKDSDYKKIFEDKKLDLSIQIINPETQNTITIQSNQKQLRELMVSTSTIFPENIIDKVIVTSKTISVIYQFKIKNQLKTEKMIIDRMKYKI